MKAPRFFWRLIRIGPRLAYAIGLGPVVGRFVLLLTTTGRKSRKARVTPLVYAELDGTFLVASARGSSADWLRNIAADALVGVRVGRVRFEGRAEIIHDIGEIADYLERQMARSPVIFGKILRLEGLPSNPTRDDIEGLARIRPMVAIRRRPE
ncbi:MAG TPA: nitroreductase family deazaflavin-dependent oxidoreductase [Anaerolineales bacterium]|nr:nitroreductase family deazaflavin-dependent oxidoreductase [Anaerolineales bacterium]